MENARDIKHCEAKLTACMEKNNKDKTSQVSSSEHREVPPILGQSTSEISYDNKGTSSIVQLPYVFGAALLASFGGISLGYDQTAISLILTMPTFTSTSLR